MPPSLTQSAQSNSVTEVEYHGNPLSPDLVEAKILERAGFIARPFQTQATLAILEGRDLIVHSATGSGKTVIFAAPHFVVDGKVSIVISPLILLQQDQRDRMSKLGLNAIAINQEVHVGPEVWDDLTNAKYQIILLSPEMALQNEKVSKVFSSPTFRKALIAIHVDEAHTISLWGGEFRKAYKGLGRIRARLPKGVPASIVSATLRPSIKQDAMATLGFSSNAADYVDINVGNERANVFVGVREMKYPASTFKDLSALIDPDETNTQKIPKTIIYIDDVNDVTLAVIALYSWLHPSLQNHGIIMPVHAWMPAWYRSDAMAKFASGEVRILVCTEAAGMGCDISDIKHVVQFGLCRSIDAFMQRIGRCWRASGGTGEGWLFIETWALTGKGGTAGETSRKASDPLLIELVNTRGCRKQYLNRVYRNPPSNHTQENQECCDNCNPDAASRFTYRAFQIAPGATRAAAVSGESNREALACLLSWRKTVFPTVFGTFSLFGAAALISDHDLERISRCTPVPSIEQLRRYLIKWSRVDSLLDSMWTALSDGGFTATQPPAEFAPPPTPARSVVSVSANQKTRRPPKSRRSNTGFQQSQGSASSTDIIPGANSSSSSNPRTPWNSFVREWMPDRQRDYVINYNTSLEDFRRFFATQAAERAQTELETKHPRSPSPSVSSKRARLDDAISSQGQAHTVPSHARETYNTSQVQPYTLHDQPTPQSRARPVAQLKVRSQRTHAAPEPTSLRSPESTRLANHRQSITLQHPLPVRRPRLGQSLSTHNRVRHLVVSAPVRPYAPPPLAQLSIAAYSNFHILLSHDTQDTRAPTADTI